VRGDHVLPDHGKTSEQLVLRTVLVRLRRSVQLLRPPDARLRRVRLDTLQALGRTIRAPRAAKAMLADAARIRAELKAYSKAKPAIGAIAPD